MLGTRQSEIDAIYMDDTIEEIYWHKKQLSWLVRLLTLADFGHKQGRCFGKRAAHPHQNLLGVPPVEIKLGTMKQK